VIPFPRSESLGKVCWSNTSTSGGIFSEIISFDFSVEGHTIRINIRAKGCSNRDSRIIWVQRWHVADLYDLIYAALISGELEVNREALLSTSIRITIFVAV